MLRSNRLSYVANTAVGAHFVDLRARCQGAGHEPAGGPIPEQGDSDVKPEDHWQAIDFPLVRLLSAKNVLRFVLNRAAAEYAGTVCRHELRVDLISYAFAHGLNDASTLWIHARDFALGGRRYAETLTDVRGVQLLGPLCQEPHGLPS